MRYFFIMSSILFLCINQVFAETVLSEINLKHEVSQQGTISFILKPDKDYKNGLPEGDFSQPLIELPGLATCYLDRSQSGVFIYLQWQEESDHIGYYLLFSDLSPSEYHILFTWDSEKGISDGYFNGIPFRTELTKFYKPWKINGSAKKCIIPKGEMEVNDIKIFDKYTSGKQVQKFTPDYLKGQNRNLIGPSDMPEPQNIESRKGELLYSIDMKNEEELKDWIFEGPGQYKFENNSMLLSSKIPNPPDFSTGHYNFWCPREFPDKIIVEWEVMLMNDIGACHIYFASKGKNGENVFSRNLPERDGHFNQYINDQIDNYYIIYFSNIQNMRTTNMATTWLTKSSKQSLLALGKIGIKPGDHRFHKMRLIKDGNHIQFQVNGKVVMDYIDNDADRYAIALENGHISFRQMARTVAAYKNFNIWELE